MKAVYNILNNQDKVTMKQFYHIICNPDLYEGFCAMRRIPCDCTRCVEQSLKPWLSILDKKPQPRYVIEPETCKYYFILCGYNKCYIAKSNFKKETTNPDKMKIKYELVLHGITRAAADNIE